MEALAAVLSGLGGIILTKAGEGVAEAERERKLLMKTYLSQLQDAAETLWFRLDNLNNQHGSSAMTPDYEEPTNIYSLGRVLALERIFVLDGVYTTIHSYDCAINDFLQRHRINTLLVGIGYHHYDRLALAEMLISADDGVLRPITYIEFFAKYKNSSSVESAIIKEAVSSFGLVLQKGPSLLQSLRAISVYLSAETGIESPSKLKNEVPTLKVPRR